jgi:hypothetical protein
VSPICKPIVILLLAPAACCSFEQQSRTQAQGCVERRGLTFSGLAALAVTYVCAAASALTSP